MSLSDEMDRDCNAECGCPVPYVMKKYQPYLGAYMEFRLCCAAKALAALVPNQTFYKVLTEEPKKWDGARPAPKYIKDRLKAK